MLSRASSARKASEKPVSANLLALYGARCGTAIDNLPNSRLNLSRIEQIAFNGQDYAAARSEIGLCTREFIRVARDERNFAVLRTNLTRKHEPKSARTARNKRNLIVQGIACRSSDAQNQPYGKDESACPPQNARIHFRKL